MNIPSSIIISFVKLNFLEAKITAKGEYQFNSPFVNDTKRRLYVNPMNNTFYDQKQQTGGSFIYFVRLYLDVSEKDALSILVRDYANKSEVENEEIIKSITKEDLQFPKGFISFVDDGLVKSRSYKIAKSYLVNRGLPYLDSGYVYDKDSDFHNRIIVPFYENSKLVYFIARSIEKYTKLRYKNISGLAAKNYVFNIDKLKEDVFIFEGVMDALSLTDQIGTATLSQRIHKEQVVKILDTAPKNIIFVLENDTNIIAIAAGKNSLVKNYELFKFYQPPSLKIKYFTYTPPAGYKDFNEESYKTGKKFIDIETECVAFGAKVIDFSDFDWGM